MLLPRFLASALGLSLALLLFQAPDARSDNGRLKILGEHSFPSGLTFQGTTVGGLSGLAYDAHRNVYYAVSDDRGELQPARFYSLEIDIGLGGIQDVRIVGVTTLDSDLDSPGVQPYENGAIDAEDIGLTPDRELIISSERDLQRRPWIRRFALDGTMLAELPVPERFIPESRADAGGQAVQTRGVRNNLGFEGLALTSDGRTLYVANEETLAQDGPFSTPENGSVVRILRYDLGPSGWQPGAEVAYRTEKVFAIPQAPDGLAVNGVSAMLAASHVWAGLDLLLVERGFAAGVGNDVWIFGVSLAGAQSTASLPALPSPFTGALASKTPLVRMADVGVTPDNLEGMSYGPRLPNGNRSLLVISDDNFSTSGSVQINQFLLFEMEGTRAEATPGQPSAPMTRAAPPAQIPAALPRTGLATEGALLVIGLGLLGIGLGMRRGR